MRADLPALVALEREFPGDRLTRRSLRHLLTRGHADVWVAAGGDGLLGDAVVLYRRGSCCARLYSLVVAPAARGRGIAQALMRTAEAGTAARGVETLRLEVRCDNRAALALYAKLGYGCIERLPRYYEDGVDGLRLQRHLSGSGPRQQTGARAA
ncbi:MAG TPA: GNAT family N-acetyltransferase [Burkholderiales bacterium]